MADVSPDIIERVVLGASSAIVWVFASCLGVMCGIGRWMFSNLQTKG